MAHDKYSCLARAKELLAEPDGVKVRYAALELRFCMESITYEKLLASAKHIPPEVLEKWQPPQAVKALLEHEPQADRAFTIFAGIEEEYGVASKDMKYVGTHTPFKLSWLRKHYNKVGKLLHHQNRDTFRMDETIAYLKEVVQEVEEATKSSILGGWLGEVYSFNCRKCDELITVAKHSVEYGRHLVCQNPSCRAEYFGKVTDDAGNAAFTLKVTNFQCGKCKAEIPIENRLLKIGFEFICEKCETPHRLENKQWGYSARLEEE